MKTAKQLRVEAGVGEYSFRPQVRQGWRGKRKLTKHERALLRAVRAEERGTVVWRPHPD